MEGRLTYLVDTSVWLELLLERDRAPEALAFLQATDAAALAATDFAVHSVGVVLTRLRKRELFNRFLADLIEEPAVRVVRLDLADLHEVPGVMAPLRLDFDDAYQYVAAEKHGLTIVSFDSDFDRTELGRKAPGEVTEPPAPPAGP